MKIHFFKSILEHFVFLATDLNHVYKSGDISGYFRLAGAITARARAQEQQQQQQ
jgi:hypothetical protein